MGNLSYRNSKFSGWISAAFHKIWAVNVSVLEQPELGRFWFDLTGLRIQPFLER